MIDRWYERRTRRPRQENWVHLRRPLTATALPQAREWALGPIRAAVLRHRCPIRWPRLATRKRRTTTRRAVVVTPTAATEDLGIIRLTFFSLYTSLSLSLYISHFYPHISSHPFALEEIIDSADGIQRFTSVYSSLYRVLCKCSVYNVCLLCDRQYCRFYCSTPTRANYFCLFHMSLQCIKSIVMGYLIASCFHSE